MGGGSEGKKKKKNVDLKWPTHFHNIFVRSYYPRKMCVTGPSSRDLLSMAACKLPQMTYPWKALDAIGERGDFLLKHLNLKTTSGWSHFQASESTHICAASFFFHYFLATPMTNWAQTLLGNTKWEYWSLIVRKVSSAFKSILHTWSCLGDTPWSGSPSRWQSGTGSQPSYPYPTIFASVGKREINNNISTFAHLGGIFI